MSLPLVSVVCSVRNGARYLAASLESVLSQEGPTLELIIIDDASTDETPQILGGFARRDPRLRVLQQDPSGLTRALARGCAEARGEFIARHDADDLSVSGRLEAQVSVLRAEPTTVMVSSWSECIGPEGEFLYATTPRLSTEGATRELLDGLRNPAHGSVMFRRQTYERVGGYRPPFYYAQDSDLWHRLVANGDLTYVPRVLYRSRVRPDSISALRAHLQRDFHMLALSCANARIEDRDETPFLEQAARLTATLSIESSTAGSPSYFIGRCLLDQRDPRSRPYLLEALKQSPASFRVWAALARSMWLRNPGRWQLDH
jgi:glycosyltransferase involved in cell wall biosynthesis